MIPSLPEGLFERLVAIRRDLHAHPELSFEETRTAGVVARELRALGLSPREGVARTGVVCDIGASPRVALRADLDALPLDEQVECPWKSTVPGVMHACAHDGHTTMLLGAAALLAAQPPNGGVRLLFQPAEERGNGADHMVKAGVMEGIGAVFGLHVDPLWDAGTMFVQAGAVNASTQTFRVFVRGRGGHAAKPHLGVDAVYVAAQIVVALQAIVSREVHPGQPAVVTVGELSGGTRHNVLAGEAKMAGTIRTFDNAVWAQIREAIVRIATGVASANRAEARVEFGEGCGAVVNDPGMAAVAREAAISLLGPDAVRPLPEPNLGGEDFSFYLLKAPGCYVRIGARPLGVASPHAAHSPAFDWDERAIAVGARWFEAVVRHALAASEPR